MTSLWLQTPFAIWRLRRGGGDERRSTGRYGTVPYSTVLERPFLGYFLEPENRGQSHGTALFPEPLISQDQNWERKEAHRTTSKLTVFPLFSACYHHGNSAFLE